KRQGRVQLQRHQLVVLVAQRLRQVHDAVGLGVLAPLFDFGDVRRRQARALRQLGDGQAPGQPGLAQLEAEDDMDRIERHRRWSTPPWPSAQDDNARRPARGPRHARRSTTPPRRTPPRGATETNAAPRRPNRRRFLEPAGPPTAPAVNAGREACTASETSLDTRLRPPATTCRYQTA